MSDAVVASPNGVNEEQAKAVRNMSGPLKAALWLLSVDEVVAVEILSRLEESEVRILRSAVKTIEQSTPEQLRAIHKDFEKSMRTPPLYVKGKSNYLTRVATKAFGSERASAILNAEEEPTKLPPSLRRADTDSVATLLRQQHPQLIAAVLASLGPEKAAELLTRMPQETAEEVLVRLSRLKRIPHLALRRAEALLAAGLPVATDADAEVDGIKIAAKLLNNVETEQVDRILDGIRSYQEPTAVAIRQAMFVFEDLVGIDTRGIQTLLKEIEQDTLLTALKTTTPAIREKMFSGLSKRASDVLRDDLEATPPARIKDVEKAQLAIVEVALRLRDEGKIVIAPPGSEPT